MRQHNQAIDLAGALSADARPRPRLRKLAATTANVRATVAIAARDDADGSGQVRLTEMPRNERVHLKAIVILKGSAHRPVSCSGRDQRRARLNERELKFPVRATESQSTQSVSHAFVDRPAIRGPSGQKLGSSRAQRICAPVRPGNTGKCCAALPANVRF